MATADPVLATEEAISTIGTLKSQIDGDLRGQIDSLLSTGDILTDPSVWNGPKAMEFEELWGEVSTSLKAANEQLNTIAGQVDAITGNIMAAGGSA